MLIALIAIMLQAICVLQFSRVFSPPRQRLVGPGLNLDQETYSFIVSDDELRLQPCLSGT